MKRDRELKPELFEDYQTLGPLQQEGTRNSEQRVERYGIMSLLGDEFKVLDIGCNAGAISLILAPHVAHVTGIDAYEKFIDVAKENCEQLGISNAEFLAKPFAREDFEENGFDLVMSLACHYWMEDLEQYAADLEYLIKPGGYLLLESHGLHREHHRDDWAELTKALARHTVVQEGQSEEFLEYPTESCVHPREFRLYRMVA